MNEELTLATEEWRQRPPGRTWLIPVRFDDGPVPAWDLGAGKTLTDLNYSDLFGVGYTPNIAQLVEAIKEVMGLTPALDPAVIQTAVGEADDEKRSARLYRLTKEMLPNPAQEIELDDLVSQEVARALEGIRDRERFPMSPKAATNSELVLDAARMALDYWQLVEPFCWSLQVAARYGTPDTLTPWTKGLRAIGAEALKVEGGHTYLVNMRLVPSLICAFTAAMAAGGQRKWANFKSLLVDVSAVDYQRSGQRLALVQAVNFWTPFEAESVTTLLAYAAKHDKSVEEGQADLESGEGAQYKTPAAQWMGAILRPLFSDQFPDGEMYENEFDATEVMLGMVAEDLGDVQAAGEPERPYYLRTKWFGQSVWRVGYRHPNPVETFTDEQNADGANWAPLRAGLFGSSAERALKATSAYKAAFDDMRSRNW